MTGKPVIYCGNPDEFNTATKPLLNYSTVIKNWNELKKAIECTIDNDNEFEERMKFIDSYLNSMNHAISDRICHSITNEL